MLKLLLFHAVCVIVFLHFYVVIVSVAAVATLQVSINTGIVTPAPSDQIMKSGHRVLLLLKKEKKNFKRSFTVMLIIRGYGLLGNSAHLRKNVFYPNKEKVVYCEFNEGGLYFR